MAEINRQDLISDEALAAPLMLADGFDKVVMSIDNVTASAKKLESSMTSGQTMAKTKSDTDALGSSLVELEKITKQYSTSTQKLSDEWQSNKKAVDAVNQAVKDKLVLGDQDAKQVNAQTNSLKQLEAALNANRKAYADLGGEAARSSKSGQELLKIIQSQDEASKKLSASMGQHQKEVGNYREAFEKLSVSAGKVAPEVEEAGETILSFGSKLSAILLSPWTLLAATIASVLGAAKASVDAFFEGTIEGEDRANQLKNAWSAAFEVIKEQAKIAGKTIVESLFGDSEHQDAMITKMAETSASIIKAVLPASMSPVVDAALENFNKKKEQANKLTEIQNDLEKEEIELIAKSAALTLEKNEEMMKAREKLGQSDQERFEAVTKSAAAGKELREAQIESINKQIEAQRTYLKELYPALQAEQKGIDLLHDKGAMAKLSYADVRKLVELEARPIEIEAEAKATARRRQALTISIIDDVLKKELDAQKTIREANALTHKTEQEAIINDSKLKLGNNSEFSVTDQLAAQKDILDAQVELNKVAQKKELDAARETAFARVQIDGDTYEKIKEQAGTNVEKLVDLYVDEKNKRVAVNEAYLKQVEAINGHYVELNVQAERDSGKGVVKIIQDNAAYFKTVKEKINTENTTEELEDLRKRYEQGNVNIIAYEKQRNLLINRSKLENLTNEATEAKNELDELKNSFGKKQTLTTEENKALLDANKKYIDAKAKQDQEAFNLEKIKAKDIYDYKLRLQAQLFTSARGIADNILASEIQDSQVRVNAFEDQKQKELDAVGKNSEKAAAINKKYTDLENEEKRKQLELKKKQAEYTKAITAVEVVITTAEKVVENADTPWNIPFIIAIGAAQEALVLSTPIPQYEKGTKSALGGLSLVGEGGAELIKSPSGQLTITPNAPTLMDLAKGSQVFTHEETIKMLALSSIGNERFVDGQNAMLHSQLATLDKTTKENGEKITRAIENADGKLVRQGKLLYRMQQDARGNQKMIRVKNLGK